MAAILLDAFSGEPRRAAARGWILALMVAPAWIVKRFGSMQLDMRFAAESAALLALLLTKQRVIPRRLVVADFLVIGLWGVQLLSQYEAGGLRPLTVPEWARLWVLPYVMGRLLIDHVDDLPRLARVIGLTCVFVSSYAIVESLTHINFINQVLGKTYGLLEQGEGYRWGLKRAQGNLDHPIFLGMMLALMLPWALEIGWEAWRSKGPTWAKILPALMLMGLLLTVSRGPQLAGICAMAWFVFFLYRWWRLPLLVLGGIVLFVGISNRAEILEAMSKYAGEDKEPTRIIRINGEPVEYTGTNHRWLLYDVYGQAVRETGWLGYGFRMQNVPIEAHLAKRFGSIDNHYLLFVLRHGWAGLYTFIALALAGLLSLLITAWRTPGPVGRLAGGLFGALLGVSILLLSVWMDPGFGDVWLFVVGTAGSLATLENPGQLSSLLDPSDEKAPPPEEVSDNGKNQDMLDVKCHNQGSQPRPTLNPGWAPRPHQDQEGTP